MLAWSHCFLQAPTVPPPLPQQLVAICFSTPAAVCALSPKPRNADVLAASSSSQGGEEERGRLRGKLPGSGPANTGAHSHLPGKGSGGLAGSF